MCHTGLLTACEQDQDVPSWSCSQAVWHIRLLCVQWKTPDDGQRNCPKHVEFYSKNKLEKLVHLVGFIIRIYHDARSPDHQIPTVLLHVASLHRSGSELQTSAVPARRILVSEWQGVCVCVCAVQTPNYMHFLSFTCDSSISNGELRDTMHSRSWLL